MMRVMPLLVTATAADNTTIPIAEGVNVPVVSFGICDHSQFIQMGGRGIDTAFSYGDGNQREVGNSVRNSGVDRSEFFVITKIPCCPATQFWGVGVGGCGQGGRNVAADLQHDMDVLGLEYVDVMMMHWACDRMDDTVNTYKQMENFMRSGKARALGVSNFNGQMLEELIQRTSIKPAVNQVGFSVGNHAKSPKNIPSKQHWGSDDQTYAKCKQLGVTLQAFSPLGGHGQYDVMGDPVVQAVAREAGRSSAQVGLRWLAQRGIAVVTCSGNPTYIKQDLQITEFELTENQMERLTAVNSDAPIPPPEVDGMRIVDTGKTSGAVPCTTEYGGGDYSKAWDGDVHTFYDYSKSDGGWTQAKLQEQVRVGHIEYFPRSGFLDRFVGGRFVGITSHGSEVDLVTISSKPTASWNGLSVRAGDTLAEVRYVAPDGGYGNVAEIKVYTPTSPTPSPVPAPTPHPTPAPYYPNVPGMSALETSAADGAGPPTTDFGGGDYSKAWDGDVRSFYDYSRSDGGWTQGKLASPAVIGHIEYYPRANFLDRHVGGRFVGITSNGNEVDLATISSTPTSNWNGLNVGAKDAVTQVRYVSPNGGWGNMAEIKVYTPSSVFV